VVDARFGRRLDGAVDARWSREHDARLRVAQDVGGFRSRQMEVDRHRRCAADQTAEMGQRRFTGVLREHGNAPFRPEVGSEQTVRDPIENLVDLAPRIGPRRIAERDGLGVGGGKGLSEGGHGRNLIAWSINGETRVAS